VSLFGRWGKREPRVVVLGGDGMEPTLLERWMASGDLPNLARLRAAGTYSRLRTTVPAESPVAWSSFISGKNPGKTGIFDFLTRDEKDYLPRLSITSVTPGPFGKPIITNNRQGGALWEHLSRAGRRVTVIQVPVTFPPEKVRGRMMSGLGVPDLRGSWGTSFYYASDLAADSATELGGRNVRLNVADGRAETQLLGPRDIPLPLRFEVVDDAHVRVTLGGAERVLALDAWSDWFEVSFPIKPPLVAAHGIVRFYVRGVRPNLRVYQSPINFHPKKPPFAFTYPESWSSELADEIGLYKSLGWATDTWGLNEGRLDEKAFLEDLHYTFDKRIEITMSALRKMDSDLVISVFNSTDRVQHMFWRFLDTEHPLYSADGARLWGGKILEVYQKLDRAVGDVMAMLGTDTTVFVLSDHGFHSFRRAVNLNTWLWQEGYLALKAGRGAEKEYSLTDLTGGGTFWPNVDWGKTRAYSMGLGKIYLNLAGREAEGIVGPGKEARAVRDAIERGIRDLKDADGGGVGNGASVVRQVYRPEEIFSGEFTGKSGDLILGFHDGYRVSWQTALGGIPDAVFAVNDRKWSGDHCSFDPEITCGTLLCSRALPLSDGLPSIMDLAPTILRILGVPIPSDLDGKPLL